MIEKSLNLHETIPCILGFAQDVLELVGQLARSFVVPSKLQSNVRAPLASLCRCVLSCQFDVVYQDYAVGLVYLAIVQIVV